MRRKINVLVALIVIIGVLFMLIPHMCSSQICRAIDNKEIKAEKFNKIVKHNIIGVNASQHLLSWCEIFDRVNYRPLNYACKKGEYEKVKILLDNGADPNKRDRSINTTPLSFALRSGKDDRFRIANILLDAGADPNAESRLSAPIFDSLILGDNKSNTALEKQSLALFTYLVQNVDSLDDPSGSNTILGAAAAYDNRSTAKYIIDNNICGINDSSELGRTALMSCMLCDNRSEMCKFLLERGADKTIKDKQGKTAYDYAIEYGREDCESLLKL